MNVTVRLIDRLRALPAFVEQTVALFADDASAKRSVLEVGAGVALAHAEAAFAARPLASGAMSQRPRVVFLIGARQHEVAEAAARAGNHHRPTLGSDGSLAMDPSGAVVDDLLPGNVVANEIDKLPAYAGKHLLKRLQSKCGCD